jgi:cob(I)alamin adenosyltransferase
VSYCHIARCVCRRKLNASVHLSHNEPVAEIAPILKPTSDYLLCWHGSCPNDLKADEVQMDSNRNSY